MLHGLFRKVDDDMMTIRPIREIMHKRQRRQINLTGDKTTSQNLLDLEVDLLLRSNGVYVALRNLRPCPKVRERVLLLQGPNIDHDQGQAHQVLVI